MATSRSNVRRRTEVPAERERMVRAQLAGRGITDEHVLEAMRRVARDAFVAPGMRNLPTRIARCRSPRGRPSRSLTSSPR